MTALPAISTLPDARRLAVPSTAAGMEAVALKLPAPQGSTNSALERRRKPPPKKPPPIKTLPGPSPAYGVVQFRARQIVASAAGSACNENVTRRKQRGSVACARARHRTGGRKAPNAGWIEQLGARQATRPTIGRSTDDEYGAGG